MKRILFVLTILLSTFLFLPKAKASSFNVSIVGNDTFENEITLYIQVNNLDDFNGACKGLCGLVGSLNYDKDKIELTSITSLENFDLTQGKTLVLYKSIGVKSGTKILSMKFKNKSLVKNDITSITLSNIAASDGDKDIIANDTSKTIKFIVKEDTNNNTTNNNNKKPNSSSTNKDEVIKKSNNNYLYSIVLSSGNISFDKNTLNYNVVVDYDIANIEINATAEDSKAIINGAGNYSLNVGSNIIKITVKAEDQTERIYTLNITREDKKIIDDTVKDDSITKSNNYTVPIVIISILVIGIVSIVILKNKKNK